jgi:hypothetical protein
MENDWVSEKINVEFRNRNEQEHQLPDSFFSVSFIGVVLPLFRSSSRYQRSPMSKGSLFLAFNCFSLFSHPIIAVAV